MIALSYQDYLPSSFLIIMGFFSSAPPQSGSRFGAEPALPEGLSSYWADCGHPNNSLLKTLVLGSIEQD